MVLLLCEIGIRKKYCTSYGCVPMQSHHPFGLGGFSIFQVVRLRLAQRLLCQNPRRPTFTVVRSPSKKGSAPRFTILRGLRPDVDQRAVVAGKGYTPEANRQAALSRGPVISR